MKEKHLAERGGFEPPVRFPAHLISSPYSLPSHCVPEAEIDYQHERHSRTFASILTHRGRQFSDKSRTNSEDRNALRSHASDEIDGGEADVSTGWSVTFFEGTLEQQNARLEELRRDPQYRMPRKEGDIPVHVEGGATCDDAYARIHERIQNRIHNRKS
jgi:hypothetical protein